MRASRSPASIRTLTERLRRAGCVFAEDEADVFRAAFPHAAPLEQAVSRREAGELVEHIVGHAHFCDLEIELVPGVFVPRARAEPLARAAAAEAARRGAGARVLDLGCGSGAIAAAVKRQVPAAEVAATDVSPAAVEVARLNGRRYGFVVYEGDWFSGLDRQRAGRFDRLARLDRYDIVVAYLPHTPQDALTMIPRDRITGEGLGSFAGGLDGLDHVRTVLGALPDRLRPSGGFLTLVAAEQSEAVIDAAARAGWVSSTTGTAYDDVVVTVGGRAR